LISGGHFNAAVTLGLVVAKRFSSLEILPYWAGQVEGAVGRICFDWVRRAYSGKVFDGGDAGGRSRVDDVLPHRDFGGVTSQRAPAGFAPISIGFTLALIHLISVPVTNLTMNPARSKGPAAFLVGWVREPLWLFWLAPLFAAALVAVIYNWLDSE